MKDCYITFRSVTAAQRGESVLRRAGMEAAVQRTPRWMEEQGCGYSLRLNRSRISKASLLLKNAGVAYRKIYVTTENGMLEEWTV